MLEVGYCSTGLPSVRSSGACNGVPASKAQVGVGQCAAGRFVHRRLPGGSMLAMPSWQIPTCEIPAILWHLFIGQYRPKAGATACIATNTTPVHTHNPPQHRRWPRRHHRHRVAQRENGTHTARSREAYGIGAAQMLTLTACASRSGPRWHRRWPVRKMCAWSLCSGRCRALSALRPWSIRCWRFHRCEL